ncbi:hypothetical protein M3Y97_00576200 [Aphelenchoides bicaudatus]|nr:hypothetical protein M3Y97_00576200 [Aphelenchoides bicaudatus]
MDSKIKEEVLDEIQQLNIKKEENYIFYTTMSDILGFEYKSSTKVFSTEFIVKVEGAQVYITDGNRACFYTCDPMSFTSEIAPGRKIKISLKTVTWRGVDNTNDKMEPINESGTLTIIFENAKDFHLFCQKLEHEGFSYLSE